MIHSGILKFLPVALIFSLAGCSGCGEEHDGPVGTARMEQGTIDPNVDASTNGDIDRDRNRSTTSNTANASDAGDGDMDRTSNNGTSVSGSNSMSNDDPAHAEEIRKARAERDAASTELKGLRAKLMSELEQVRDKLRDGTLTKMQREKDQARAASLAQGLARLDTALEEIDASTDATWAQIKEHSNKEVKDLREWMKENDVDGVVES